jgi:hypothetical protein
MSTGQGRFALSSEQVTAAVASLQRAADALASPTVDLSAVRVLLTPQNVIAAAVTGADPSPCAAHVTRMLSGGLAGLRAFLHLATETGQLVASGFDPGSETTPVEPLIASLRAGQTPEQLVLIRHAALFTFEQTVGPTLWAKAHVLGLTAELELVESLLHAEGAAFDRGMLFWFDPGTPPAEATSNVDFLVKLGLPLPPQSTADRASMRAGYESLSKRSGMPLPAAPAAVVTHWP